MKNLILLRGLPGSGKSTLAVELYSTMFPLIGLENEYKQSVLHTAADLFMIDKEGRYKFDPDKLKYAHDKCKQSVESGMQHKTDWIFVHNTFTTKWEMEDYYKLAEQYKYRVFSIIVENRHGNDSVHNVPDETLEKMKQRFEIKL